MQAVILGGDGAGWIEKGREVLSQVIRQVDGFHLKRACVRALGRELGERLYAAIRAGRWGEAEAIWATAPRREGQRAQEATRWLAGLLVRRDGVDWRVQVKQAPADARGLGAMEGNLAHLIADRMKDKGRSWSRRGAIHMAKVREQVVNGTLSHWWQKPRARVASAAYQTPITRQRTVVRAGTALPTKLIQSLPRLSVLDKLARADYNTGTSTRRFLHQPTSQPTRRTHHGRPGTARTLPAHRRACAPL